MAEQATAFAMPAHGSVCWNELVTKDIEAAKTFYSELLGWTMVESKAAGAGYIEAHAGGCPVAGLMQMTAECGDGPSHWGSYVAVKNVDEAAQRAAELGGQVLMPPMDIPNVGRFCMINDPTGATISLITMRAHE